MNKKVMIICLILTIISLMFFVYSLSFKDQKVQSLQDKKTAYGSTKNDIEALQKENNDTSRLVDKIDHDPDVLAKDAASKTQDFIKIIEENESKSDEDKAKIYDRKLSDLVSDNLLDNIDLTSISVPKDYDIDVSTSRSDTLPVLVSNKDRYLVVTYDTLNDQIVSIEEYKKS
ncbi:hypothetical protein H6K86_11810 [Staphylococcus epidermidis]|nr:hypothetical protein [Staphylococcus epidermidis]MBM6209936.1 hypothetical protein [Staphylococcus epidermidis]MBM6223765.1 hypothetical protein [Staphylococcus epidermidis]MBM6226126.1 hypothetical protein [Staphylococcus epidermidis]MBM6230788.1 hypothetical protein [Staphylococcus epidermidis]